MIFIEVFCEDDKIITVNNNVGPELNTKIFSINTTNPKDNSVSKHILILISQDQEFLDSLSPNEEDFDDEDYDDEDIEDEEDTNNKDLSKNAKKVSLTIKEITNLNSKKQKRK